jgi:16S rRNA (guanine527-N7)-methyltransferase
MSSRFAEGLAHLNLLLSDHIIQKELDFLDELLRWNQRVNLTSIRNRDEAIEKHLLDSLLLLPHLGDAKKIIDIGSGGGLPGIPLAIADTNLKVLSIDSVGKKINFQKHIKRLLQLNNLTVMQSRIENLTQTALEQEKYDLVLSRAFSSLDISLRYAAPWLKPGGRLVAMKGPEGREELRAAEKMIKQKNFYDWEVIAYELPFSSAERQLVILKK